jgi:hypothetical protein
VESVVICGLLSWMKSAIMQAELNTCETIAWVKVNIGAIEKLPCFWIKTPGVCGTCISTGVITKTAKLYIGVKTPFYITALAIVEKLKSATVALTLWFR